MADFLALQLVLTARSGPPLRLPTFWIPVGPRAHISCSPIRLSSLRFPLYIYIPVSACSSRLLSACPFSFNTRAPPVIPCHQTRRAERLFYPSLTSVPIPLLFSQFASQYSKNLVPHYSTPVVQRYLVYSRSLVVSGSLALCLFLSTLCATDFDSSTSLLIAFPCVESLSPSFLSSCSLRSTLPRIRSSRYLTLNIFTYSRKSKREAYPEPLRPSCQPKHVPNLGILEKIIGGRDERIFTGS